MNLVYKTPFGYIVVDNIYMLRAAGYIFHKLNHIEIKNMLVGRTFTSHGRHLARGSQFTDHRLKVYKICLFTVFSF